MSPTNCLIRLKLYRPRLPEASRTKPISIARLQAELEIRVYSEIFLRKQSWVSLKGGASGIDYGDIQTKKLCNEARVECAPFP